MMVAMVFMILYLIAVVATTSLFIVAWLDEPDVTPKGVAILIAIVCGIAWPIVAVGILAYIVKYGMLDEEEES